MIFLMRFGFISMNQPFIKTRTIINKHVIGFPPTSLLFLRLSYSSRDQPEPYGLVELRRDDSEVGECFRAAAVTVSFLFFLFYFILFYFILFYFILFYFILFYFILFY